MQTLSDSGIFNTVFLEFRYLHFMRTNCHLWIWWCIPCFASSCNL